MSRSRTFGSLGLVALFALALFGVLRMRTRNVGALELPSGAQAAGEKSAESSPALSEDVSARRVNASEQAFTPAPVVDKAQAARVTIEVVAAGQPVKEGEVELVRAGSEEARKAKIDPLDGCARFDAVSPGTYWIVLAQLPRGFVPPRAFQRNSAPDDEQKRVMLAGEDLTRRIELEPAVHVFGYVHTPDGELAQSFVMGTGSMSGSTVQAVFTCRNGSWERSVSAKVFNVIDGRYEGDLVEGLWVVTLAGTPGRNEKGPRFASSTSAPALRRLPPGSDTQIDLEFGSLGNCELRGSIRDEQGQPFGGLHLGANRMHALVEPKTGESLEWPDGGGPAVSSPTDGTFSISGLLPGRYQVFVEPEGYHPLSPPGGGKVGEVVQFRDVEVVDGVTSLELTIRRPHPVHVTGRVVIDAAWAKEHAADGILPMMDLVRGSGRDNLPDTRDPVRVRPEGFEFWLDSGVKDPRLELWLSTEKIVEVLHLSDAGEPAPIVIRIPH